MVSPTGYPSYPPGSTVIVDPRIPPTVGRRMFYRLPDEPGVTFGELTTDGVRQFLKPLNPRYPMIQLPSGARYCGTVVETFVPEPWADP